VPAFSLIGDDGQTYSAASLKGQRFVLYFYPKDNTPGCTQEACDFNERQGQFDDKSITVLGVSSDSTASHNNFRSRYSLGFPLLSDPDREVADAFGAIGEKQMYGQTKVGIIRSTFVVDANGKIEKVYSPVRVPGHAQAVLEAVS
jgi:peroxiredoxin Q/BCP